MKSYTTQIQIFNDLDECVAVVESFDVCAKVSLTGQVQTVESWDELSAAIRAAIVKITEAQ